MVHLEPPHDGDLIVATLCETSTHLGEDAEAFSSFFSSLGPSRPRPSISKFMKKIYEILEINLRPSIPPRASLSLFERGLVGRFNGLFPSTVLF